MQGFAAWKCGLFSCFDKVVSINGQHVAGMDLSEIKKLTIGNEGTVCTMVMRRGHDDGILFFPRVSFCATLLSTCLGILQSSALLPSIKEAAPQLMQVAMLRALCAKSRIPSTGAR